VKASFERVAECLYRNHRGVYFALVKVSRKQIKRSLQTKDRQLANRLLARFREKAERLDGSSHRDVRFNELGDQWLESIRSGLKPSSYQRRVSSLNQMKSFFKGEMIRGISADQIDRWKSSRGNEVSARTFNIDLETLRLLFDYAKDVKRIILENPLEDVRRKKEPRRTPPIPTKDQFSAMVAALRAAPQASVPGGAADLVEFLGYSGCRLGEAREILWEDINFKRETLHITGGEKLTKNHEHRTIPLFSPLIELLGRMKDKRDERAKLFSVMHSRNAILNVCDRLRLPQFGHHSMRHFFCSNAIEEGIDFKVIAGWLGHKDGGILVAKTYGHLRQDHSKQMAQRMTFSAVRSAD
jgi:integrase